MAAPSVLPGQPLHEPSNSTSTASVAPGKGAFERNGTIFSSAVGTAVREGGLVGVQGKEENASVPETGNTVRLQDALSILLYEHQADFDALAGSGNSDKTY